MVVLSRRSASGQTQHLSPCKGQRVSALLVKIPKNILDDIQIRAEQKVGLIPFSPLQPLRDRFKAFNEALYRRAGIKFGVSFHHLFQGASNVLPKTADSGTATDNDITGTLGYVSPWSTYNGRD